MDYHEPTMHTDENGWPFISCECGWSCPVCPELVDAVEVYGDHRAEVALVLAGHH